MAVRPVRHTGAMTTPTGRRTLTSRASPPVPGSLQAWVAALPDAAPPDAPFDAAALVRSGVPETDLDAYSAALWPGQPVNEFAAAALAKDLRTLAGRWPRMTLRSGLGWALLVGGRHGIAAGSKAVPATAAPWVKQGMGETGWLFEAAGIGLVDAAAILTEAGAVEDEAPLPGASERWDAVRVMAALSGMPLPT